jgi:hypothetical protein
MPCSVLSVLLGWRAKRERHAQSVPEEALSLLSSYLAATMGAMEFASAIESIRLRVASREVQTPERWVFLTRNTGGTIRFQD